MPKKFDSHNEIRAIARERIGPVPGRKIEVPKTKRPPKHKKREIEE